MSTYATLQTDVADYLHRTDLTAKMPTFIAQAEASIFREISIKATETSVIGVTVGGYAILPVNFGSVTRLSITANGTARVLDYIALADTATASISTPGFYSFENGNLRIWGSTDGQAYTLYYIPTITPLSNINTTNWVLTNASDLYLYATALEAAKYIRDDAQIQGLTGMVGAIVDSVRRLAERVGVPSSGSLQIKAR
jgi:hypothetical protein